MTNILGLEVDTPTIDVSGWLSSSWIYVFIIAIIGFFLIAGICILLFYMTYNKKVVVFENISGAGYQRVLKSRARLVKLGSGGEEILKTLFGGQYVSAYGRKMGRNTYWYCKGQDGYWYNITLGDLDTKLAMLDIEPVDRDVRMFHVSVDRLSHQTYGKQNFLEKYGIHIMLFAFLVIMLIGFWIIAGKINEGLSASTQAAPMMKETAELLNSMAVKLDNIQRGFASSGGSGLEPAG